MIRQRCNHFSFILFLTLQQPPLIIALQCRYVIKQERVVGTLARKLDLREMGNDGNLLLFQLYLNNIRP